MKRIALIDRQEDSRYYLRKLFKEYFPKLLICGEASTISDGRRLINQTQPHGVIINALLEDGNAFDVLDSFPNGFFECILTAENDSYALKAFQYKILDYIIKPIQSAQFCTAIHRFMDSNIISEVKPLYYESNSPLKEEKVLLSSSDGILLLRLSHIVHLESNGSFTTVYTLDRDHFLISKTLKKLETMLPSDLFLRIHQSYLVNLMYVRRICTKNDLYVQLDNGFRIPVARRRKELFMQSIKARYNQPVIKNIL